MRKLLNWVAAVTLVVGIIGIGGNGSKAQAAEAQTFKDVGVNAWYYSYVNDALSRGVISGFPNGTFKPDDPVTVAQFLKIVLLSYTDDTAGFTYWSDSALEYAPDWREQTLFKSVQSFEQGNPWYINFVNTATNLGLIEKGEFVGRYNEPITRERAAHIIDNLDAYFYGGFQQEYSMLAGAQFFKDFNKTDIYYQEQVANVALRGIMAGNDKGYFNPKAYLSRAEVSKISTLLFDVGKRTEKIPNLNGIPYDVVTGNLGYKDRIHIFANQEMLENFKIMKERQTSYKGFVSLSGPSLLYFKDEEAKKNADRKTYYNLFNDPNVYHDLTISFNHNAYSIIVNVDKESYVRARSELKYFVEKVFAENGAKVFAEVETAIKNAQALKDVKVDKTYSRRQLVMSNLNKSVLNIGISAYSDL